MAESETTTAKPMSEEREREIRDMVRPGRIVSTSIDSVFALAKGLQDAFSTIDELRAKAKRDDAAAANERGFTVHLDPEQVPPEGLTIEIDRVPWGIQTRMRVRAAEPVSDDVQAQIAEADAATFAAAEQAMADLCDEEGDDLQARIDAAVAKAMGDSMRWTYAKPLPPEPTICDSTTGEPLPKIGPEQPPAEPFVDIVRDRHGYLIRFEDASGKPVVFGEERHTIEDGRWILRIPDPRQVAELRRKLEAEQIRFRVASAGLDEIATICGVTRTDGILMPLLVRNVFDGLRAKLAEAEKERDELRARLDAYLASETFASVVLLRALREHAPQAAEEVARWLWAPWEDGSVPSVHLWGLLDAEGLTTAFERMREARHRRRKEADRG